MLALEKVSKAFGADRLFDDCSFVLGRGDRVGLVGRNGCGKTTLLRIIAGSEIADSGMVSLPKEYKVGYLEQHIVFSADTILSEATTSLAPGEEYKAKKVLSGLGIDESQWQRSPAELSGGYQLRLHLAKILISHPDLLLLDEPTNYLDIVSIRWLERFLARWPRELIIISHDREFMERVATHTMAIHRGKVRKIKGSVYDLYDLLAKEEEIHNKRYASELKKRQHDEQFVNRFRSKASKATLVQSRLKAMRKQLPMDPMQEMRNLAFRFNYAPYTGRNLIEAEKISFAYETNGKKIVVDFSVEIENHDRIAIIGRNGIGKTTLLNLLAGELQPDAGKVKCYDRTQIGYFGQRHIQRLDKMKTVEEEIALANPELSYREVKTICGLMMFEGDRAKKYVQVLSGGERSRVVVGKILAAPTNLLLLDEPSHHLDMESIEALLDSIAEFDGAVVMVSHDEMILRAMATKLIICHADGQEIFLGSYDDFLEKKGWPEEKEENSKINNKKQQRIQRAEFIQTRASVLNPIKKEIRKIEEKIIDLEEQRSLLEGELIQASTAGDGNKIRTVSCQIHDLTEQIDNLFSKLEDLTTELETKEKQF